MITLILFVVISILVSSLVFASRASTELPSGDDLKKAKSKLVWVSVVGWLSVILLVIGGIFFAMEVVMSTALSYLAVLVIFGLLCFISWLTVSATSQISSSSEYKSDKDRTSKINVSHDNSYTSGALSLGTVIALVVVMISYYSGKASSRWYY